VNRLLEEQPGAGRAHLAFVVEDPGHGAADRGVHIGVGEHDVRRLAAQLEGQPLQRAGGLAHDRLADLGGTGEGDLVHARIVHQRHADLAAGAGDDVEDALRQPRLLAQLGELERGQRRLRGRLQHHGVAGGQRGGDLPRREQEGEVPGHDCADHADRLPQREREGVVPQRQRLAVDLAGPAAEVPEHLGRERDLDLAGIEQRLAGAQALQPRHLVQVLLDQLAQPPHDPPALVGAHLGPRALVEGLAGRRHRGVDVALVGFADGGQELLVGRIDGLIGFPGHRRLPLA
jgi:hypothetical protein